MAPDASDDTRWTVIRDAAAGNVAAREAFARRYLPAVKAYLGTRWRSSPLLSEVDDAAQEVFVECFREAGALERVDPEREGGFRAFLYGVVRNVARRHETRRARRRAKERSPGPELEQTEADEPALSEAFDRAWALSVMRQAGARQIEHARGNGADALKRVDLLRLRIVEGKPIREIARTWGEDPTHLHREYARARREFRRALREIVAGVHPGPPEAIEAECRHLLDHFQAS